MHEHSFALEMPADLPWVNAAGPPDLSGQVVMLVFWSSACVHSRHLIATVDRELRRDRARAVAAVGVHTPTFDAQRGEAHVARVVRERGVDFPVLVDDERALWRGYGCSAVPTLILIDPIGQVRYLGGGEVVDEERLSAVIDALHDEAAVDGHLGAPPAPPAGADPWPRDSALAAPTKLAIDPYRRWLWIADTARHRLIAADSLTGDVQLVAGTGSAGADDGALSSASFCHPRGMAVWDDTLFVADAGQHLVRAISLLDEQVRTVLGHGRRAVDAHGGGTSTDQGLASPWDVAMHEDELFIAMAGAHQVWSMDPHTQVACSYAGHGRPALDDGEPIASGFAQPSGLACAVGTVAVVDAQSSAVRLVDVHHSEVETVVGGGLGDHGDRVGPFASARLQHPTDVAALGDDWVIADTYNDAVKRLRMDTGEVEAILGPADGLRAPEGVVVDGDTMFVADTGNDRILRVDLSSGAAQEFAVRGL